MLQHTAQFIERMMPVILAKAYDPCLTDRKQAKKDYCGCVSCRARYYLEMVEGKNVQLDLL